MPHNYPGLQKREQDLFDRAKKFQSKKAHFPDGILAQDLGGDWRGSTGNKTRRGGRRGRNGQVYDLIKADDVGRGYTGPSSTNIKSFGELDEFGPGRVGAANENRHL